MRSLFNCFSRYLSMNNNSNYFQFLRRGELVFYFCFSLIFATVFFLPFQEISIANFHADDAGLISFLNRLDGFQAVMNFIFSPGGAHKFRPIAHLQWFVEGLLAPNLNFYIFYNLILISIICVQVIDIVREKINLIFGFSIIIFISLSKFSLYGIWNITGSFELLSAIIYLVLLKGIIKKKSIIILSFISILLLLTSEKYLPFVVFLPFILSYVDGTRVFSIKNIFFGPGVLLAFIILRVSLGIPIFVGTQTDSIVDSFNFLRVIKHYILSFFELFGISMGPGYLTGIDFIDWVPLATLYHERVYMFTLFIGAILFLFSWTNFIVRCFMLNKVVHALIFIFFLMILPASITFRLELRWLLPAFLTLLILMFSGAPIRPEMKNSSLSGFDYFKFYTFNIYGYCLALILFSLNYAYHWRGELFFAGKLIGLPLMGK